MFLTTNIKKNRKKKTFLNMFGVKYLTEEHLKGFERYKYNSVDTSYLSVYIMHPFWNWCVQFFPKWMAPNVITLSGFLLNVFTFILIAYYDWDFWGAQYPDNEVPQWVWLVAAIAIFVAYNLDGIDGKQARRTGTSGPLGELFDHGLDSYSTCLIPIYMFSLFGTGNITPLRMYFVLFNVFQNFYLSHFEKYNTNVMFLPWGFDMTMWGVTITLIITYIVGPWVWTYPLSGLTPANIFEIGLLVSSFATNHPIIAKNIYYSYKNRTGKMRTFSEAARPLYPLFSLFGISLFWVVFSENDILNLEPRIVFILLGTIFSNISCRLIVAQMSDTRTDSFNILLWPLLAVSIISCFPFRIFDVNLSMHMERWILHGLTIFVTIAHIHYGQGIVREMCNHFNISCFKISRNNNLPTAEMA